MIYIVIGRREQGKTTLAYRMASKLPKRLVFDPRGMIGGSGRVTTGSGLQDACDGLADGGLSEVVFTPFGDAASGFVQFSAEVQRWVVEYPDSPIAVLVDEVLFTGTKDRKVVAFDWALRCCKRDTVHIIMTGHRPSDVRTDIRALADHWCLFAIRQEHDLDVIRERCTSDVVTAVQQLEPRQFIQWDDARGLSTRYSDPTSWFIELRPAVSITGPQLSPTMALQELPGEPVPSARFDTRKLF